MTRNIDVIIIRRIDEMILTAEQSTIQDSLEAYYSIIGCSTIDIVKRKIGGVVFDIIVDDWGLIKARENHELPTSIWYKKEHLYGTLILCHSNEEGDLTSVNPEDLFAVHRATTKYHAKECANFGALEHCL